MCEKNVARTGRGFTLNCRCRRTQDGTGGSEYLVEACDPCEADAYTIDGIAVSDFHYAELL
jgi:hypothetical protein